MILIEFNQVFVFVDKNKPVSVFREKSVSEVGDINLEEKLFFQ